MSQHVFDRRAMPMSMAKPLTLILSLAMLTATLGSDDTQPLPRQGEWLPVPPQSLAVAQGSALDFSALVPDQAGSNGPLRLNADGHFTLGGSPDPRFNCGMDENSPGMTWALPDHAAADALAVQFRRHGYNLVRFHYMDARLMQGSKADFAFNPENVDRFYYLLAALKRNGVYWMLDMMTSYDGGRLQSYDGTRSINAVKVRLNYDPSAQADWIKMVDAVYNKTNPYTGRSTLSDPALAFVVGANENSIAFWSQLARDGAFPPGIGKKFDQWMRQRYPKSAELSVAMPDATSAELSGQTPIALPANWNATGQRMNFFLRFASSLEVDSYRWMQQQLRDRGYAGPLLGFPEWYKQIDNRTRSALPVTDIHAYVGEVSSYARGSQLLLPSMMDRAGLGSTTTNAAARWLDRPLVSSEYGMPFPNPYRRESGLMFPSVSAFQGYAAICRMANLSVEPAINDKGAPIFPYRVGVDPIARVAETLSTFLFYRRDVAQASKGVVAIPFGETEKNRIGSGFLPFEIRTSALLARFGLIDPDKVDTLPQPRAIVPLPRAPYGFSAKAVGKVVDMLTGDAQESEKRLIATLFDNGILPKGNLTDPDRGIYQSYTGQMTLDMQGGSLRIVTPRTEAITTRASASNVTLGALSLVSLDAGALVAATALDGQPLPQSRKILLMLAGDASNTNLALGGRSMTRSVIDWGQLPILLQRVQASVRLRSAGAFKGSFSILGLDGSVTQMRGVSSDGDGTITLPLDTRGAAGKPTTYFLLEKNS